MRVWLVLRTLNEEYFIRKFLRYYTDLAADRIMIFDSGSADGTLREIKQFRSTFPNPSITVYRVPTSFTDYESEVAINMEAWETVLGEYENHPEETLVLFIDADEYIVLDETARTLNDLASSRSLTDILYRSMLIERYPNSPDFQPDTLTYRHLQPSNIDLSFPYTRIMDLWEDPIYKYSVVLLNEDRKSVV